MHDDLLSIGALARAGDLPVSALRFYDAAGVLRPAHVDPASGYRWYTSAQVHTARLVASLRQAGLPVADLVAVLADPSDAPAVLARHRGRLESDLLAACTHLEAAQEILSQAGECLVTAADLAIAVGAVRDAVGVDADWPGLAGVLFHLDGRTLRLVGCDRRRLAVAAVPIRHAVGPETRVIVPLTVLDEALSGALPDEGRVVLGPSAAMVLGHEARPLDAPYPDYEQLLRSSASRSATVTSRDLMTSIDESGDVVALRLHRGEVRLGPPRSPDTHGYSRTFLLDAVRAARTDRVDLAVDAGRSTLRVSPAGRPRDVHLVMPIRLIG